MRKVTGEEEVARLAAQAIAHPRWWVVGLQIARRGEFRERVARAPEGLGRLPRPQLAAVPHDGRAHAARGGAGSQARHVLLSARRQRTPRVDVRADRVAVMNQEEPHSPAFYPAEFWNDKGGHTGKGSYP